MLTILYDFIFTLLSCFPIYFAFTQFLIYPLTNKQRITLLVVQMLLFYFTFEQFGQSSAPFVFLITGILIFCFQKHIIINTCCMLFGYIFCVCCNYLCTNFLCVIGFSFYDLRTKYLFTFSIFFDLLLYIVSFYLGRFLRKQYFRLNIKFSSKVQIIFLVELLLCFTIFLVNIITAEALGYPQRAILVNFILFFIFLVVTLIIFGFAIFLLRKEANLEMELKDFENLQEYTNKVETLYQDLRSFKHDYTNILLSLRTYIEDKDFENLSAYFQEKIMPYDQEIQADAKILSHLSQLQVLPLKSLIYSKLLVAMNNNLNIQLEIPVSVNQINMSDLDLVKVVGIFLDNAIEAAKETEDKILTISIVSSHESTVLSINNSYLGDIVNRKAIYELGYSTKGENRGVGLFNAKNVLSTYPNVIHKTTYKAYVFGQTLEIL